MELNKLEEIIANQMRNVYKKVRYGESYDWLPNNYKPSKIYTNINGSELIEYPDCISNIKDPIERMRERVLNKHIGFSYFEEIIILCLDENWSENEVSNFIDKTINQKEIVDAINSGELKLKIDGLKQENYFYYEKEIPYYDWRSLQRNGWNIFAVIDSLKAIGIDVKLGDK